ncbi:hypothetical protein RS130_19520 [Paraglaciecola aquimarina]|uniref:Uncharacterized protein n=1 Tax=Paraglaciecola aquimarina TaxID=1235557 RepID=A0ABU3T0T0_9ALTE|nr:hypothetical protein [Paraglaciecola aquimarina]MDU0355782.1 hypothetical protein [Paraglaciecola aquimarina]
MKNNEDSNGNVFQRKVVSSLLCMQPELTGLISPIKYEHHV